MLIHSEMIGMPIEVYANQAMREGVVLIAVDKRALIEYVMPAGRTFLRLLSIDEHGYVDPNGGRSVSYNAIPKKFLEAIRGSCRGRVMEFLRGGFSPEDAPATRGWHRAHNERERERARYVRETILKRVS